MNKNSYICRYIDDNPDTWEKYFKEELDLNINYATINKNYAVMSYKQTCDFYNPIVREARGIIVDVKNKSIVCWPFTKFGNYDCGYADEIDWTTARVQEKLDGSIIKLWYNKSEDNWQFSTNRCFSVWEARIYNSTKTFGDLLKECSNFDELIHKMKNLNKDLTYIFEVVSPENQIVIKYNESKLYHIGTRNNITGEECNPDIGIEKPKEYKIATLGDCIKAVEAINPKNETICHEGFVVVDGNYHRIKIKSPDYFYASRYLTKIHSTEGLLLALRQNMSLGETMKALRAADAERIERFTQYTKYLYKKAEAIYNKVKQLDQEGVPRKEIAETLRGDDSLRRLSSIGFLYFRYKDIPKPTGEIVVDILNSLSKDTYVRLFEDIIPQEENK